MRPARAIGKLERLCYERQRADLRAARAPGGHPRGLRFSWAAGNRVVQFIERYCRHHIGEWAGKLIKLEKWQKRIIRTTFGWLRADGTRRFRTCYVEIPRKNSKSTMAAGLGLYLEGADNEPGADVFSSATKQEQARIVWHTAAEMVRASPELRRFFKVFKTAITVDRTGSSFKPLGADAHTLDGLNPHGNIVDELHAHRDRALWDVLASAMGARRQPMTIAITTAGVYDPTSIGWEIHDYAVNVLEGRFEDDAFFAFIAAADEGDDWFSPETHAKANPNYGVSVKPEFLVEQATGAKRKPSALPEYLTKHLNVWSQQAKSWLAMDRWALSDAAGPVGADPRALTEARETALEKRLCRGGLDLSTKIDLSALVLEFPNDDESVDLVCRFWIPEERVKEESAKGRRHYETWLREGWLVATPGDVVDYEFIRTEVNALAKRYVLKELAYDPWGATDLSNRLTADGLTMVECRQGYQTLSEPSKDVEAKVLQLKVRHMNNPVLRWCAGNAVTTSDPAGNIKPDKRTSKGKIDGVVAWVMARSRGIANKVQPSVYETRGFRSL